MPRPRSAPALLGVALSAVFVAGCGTGGPPSQSGTRDNIRDQIVEQNPDLDIAVAGEFADCVSRGLYESGEFTREERDDVVRASGDDVDPALAAKVEALREACADDAGVPADAFTSTTLG